MARGAVLGRFLASSFFFVCGLVGDLGILGCREGGRKEGLWWEEDRKMQRGGYEIAGEILRKKTRGRKERVYNISGRLQILKRKRSWNQTILEEKEPQGSPRRGRI